jgi:hypothetical protein
MCHSLTRIVAYRHSLHIRFSLLLIDGGHGPCESRRVAFPRSFGRTAGFWLYAHVQLLTSKVFTMVAHGTVITGILFWLAASVDQNGVQGPILSPLPRTVLKAPTDRASEPVKRASATEDADSGIFSEEPSSVLGPKLESPPPSNAPDPLPSDSGAPGERAPRAGKFRPADLLKELSAHPTRVAGDKLSLVKVLQKTAADRKQQERGVLAYWQLTSALYELSAVDRTGESLERDFPRGMRQSAFLAAEAAQRATATQAKQRVVKAQFDLAEAIGQPAGDPLPLPADLPHVKNYVTNLNQRFRAGSVPPKLILLDKRLEVLRALLVDRCSAVLAAEDVTHELLGGVGDRPSASELVSAWEAGLRQRRAFAEAVREYNSDIAEFALTVAPAGTTPDKLASMLILETTTSNSDNATQSHGVKPSFQLAGYQPPSSKPSTALFPGLAHLSPMLQSQKLGQLLHQGYAGSEQSSPRTLADCLEQVPASSRGSFLESFWFGHEAAAQNNVLASTLEQLQSLGVFLREQTAGGGRARGMLQVRAAELAVKADLDEARLRLLNEQYSLGVLLGANLEKSWVLPGSSPHTGGYDIPTSQAKTSLARAKQEAAIALLQEDLRAWSTAVVQADLHRADLQQAAEDAPAKLNLAAELDAIDRQRHVTMNFLRSAREYNVAISKYVVAIAPTDISARRLAETLVLSGREK